MKETALNNDLEIGDEEARKAPGVTPSSFKKNVPFPLYSYFAFPILILLH